MSPLSVLGLAFVLGVKHALDADHVAAVSAIVARHKRLGTAWLLGAFWGFGHTATVFAVGALLIVSRMRIPERLGLGLEWCVGAMLLAIGAMSMAGRLGGGVVSHEHRHGHDAEHAHDGAGSHSHAHLHLPADGWLLAGLKRAGPWQLFRAALVGLVHGLAGSAAVALLALAAIPDPKLGVLYLLVFGAGTVAGMMAVSAAMEWSLVSLARWWAAGEKAVSFAAGAISAAVGLYILYWTSREGGLF